MTPKERQLAAIAHKVPDRIPIDAICVENLREIGAQLGLDYEQSMDALGIDGRCVTVGPYQGEKEPGLDEWGSSAFDDYSSNRRYPIADEEDLRRYRMPDPDCYPFADAGRAAAFYAPRYAVRGPYWKPLFCQVNSLMGMENSIISILAEPELFEGVLEMVFAHTYRFCENYLNACGKDLDIFYLGDDFAGQRGLLFSPELWRKFLKPRYQKLFELGKKHGKLVWFHSCGNILSVLPDLIETGVDVWETVQLHTLPITPQELKREYGRDITFFGGLSTQALPFLGPDEAAAETRRVIEALGEGGGYIFGPDHHIKPDVSVESTRALFEAARTFCREGWTG